MAGNNLFIFRGAAFAIAVLLLALNVTGCREREDQNKLLVYTESSGALTKENEKPGKSPNQTSADSGSPKNKTFNKNGSSDVRIPESDEPAQKGQSSAVGKEDSSQSGQDHGKTASSHGSSISQNKPDGKGTSSQSPSKGSPTSSQPGETTAPTTPDALGTYHLAEEKLNGADSLICDFQNVLSGSGASKTIQGSLRYTARNSSPIFLQITDDGNKKTTTYGDKDGIMRQEINAAMISPIFRPTGASANPLSEPLVPQASRNDVSSSSIAADGTGWSVSLDFSAFDQLSGVFRLLNANYQPYPGDRVESLHMTCSISGDGSLRSVSEQFHIQYRTMQISVAIQKKFYNEGKYVTVQKPAFQ